MSQKTRIKAPIDWDFVSFFSPYHRIRPKKNGFSILNIPRNPGELGKIQAIECHPPDSNQRLRQMTSGDTKRRRVTKKNTCSKVLGMVNNMCVRANFQMEGEGYSSDQPPQPVFVSKFRENGEKGKNLFWKEHINPAEARL